MQLASVSNSLKEQFALEAKVPVETDGVQVTVHGGRD